MRTASAATFRVDRALSLPPAAHLRAFCRRHAAARSKAAAAGSRGSRARCIHRLSRAQPWVLLVKPPPPTPGFPYQPMARAEALLDRVLLIRFRGRFPIATTAKDRTGPQLQVTDHADLSRTRVHRLGKRVGEPMPTIFCLRHSPHTAARYSNRYAPWVPGQASRSVPVATDLKAGSSDSSERLAMVPPGQPMSSSRAYWSVVASQNSTTLPSCRWKTCASLTVMFRPPRLAVAATSATPCSSSAKTA